LTFTALVLQYGIPTKQGSASLSRLVVIYIHQYPIIRARAFQAREGDVFFIKSYLMSKKQVECRNRLFLILLSIQTDSNKTIQTKIENSEEFSNEFYTLLILVFQNGYEVSNLETFERFVNKTHPTKC